MADLKSVNNQLKNDPQYRAALAGEINVGQFPTGPDGLVLPGFRKENARYYASLKAGGGVYDPTKAPGGAINDSGEFYDPNATHWYDPQYMGPLAVGAATGLGALGAFGGGGGAVGGGATAASAAPEASAATTGATAAASGTAAGKAANVMKTASGSSGGMGLGKLLTLMGVQTGLEGLMSAIGGSDSERESFKGVKAPNGQSVDPATIYGEGLGYLREFMPTMRQKVNTPTQLRNVFAQDVSGLSGSDPGGQDPRFKLKQPRQGTNEDDLSSAMSLFKGLGF